jgi:hypothetical protein
MRVSVQLVRILEMVPERTTAETVGLVVASFPRLLDRGYIAQVVAVLDPESAALVKTQLRV